MKFKDNISNHKPDLIEAIKKDGQCIRDPYHAIQCEYNYYCYFCPHAEKFALTSLKYPNKIPAADNEISILHEKGGSIYYKKNVLLYPGTLELYELPKLLYYQFFFCIDGPGVFPYNPYSEVDGYFLFAPENIITINRSDIMGLPSLPVCELYDKTFYFSTAKENGLLRR